MHYGSSGVGDRYGGLVACVCVCVCVRAGRRSIRRQHASAAGAARRLSVDGGRAPATRQPLLQRAVRRSPVRYTAVIHRAPTPSASPNHTQTDRSPSLSRRAHTTVAVKRRRPRSSIAARARDRPRLRGSIIGAPPAGGQERQASSRRRRRPTNDSGVVVVIVAVVYASRAQCPSGRRRRRHRCSRRLRVHVVVSEFSSDRRRVCRRRVWRARRLLAHLPSYRAAAKRSRPTTLITLFFADMCSCRRGLCRPDSLPLLLTATVNVCTGYPARRSDGLLSC